MLVSGMDRIQNPLNTVTVMDCLARVLFNMSFFTNVNQIQLGSINSCL